MVEVATGMAEVATGMAEVATGGCYWNDRGCYRVLQVGCQMQNANCEEAVVTTQ